MYLLQRKFSSIFFLLVLFFCSSCEIEFLTKSLWESYYEEEVATFLISTDKSYIAFLSKKYHYVFNDETGNLHKLIELDHQNIIFIDTKKTHLKLNTKNEIEGKILFKTFDAKFTPQNLENLEFMGFDFSQKEQDYELEFAVKGKRYLAMDDFIYYLPISDDKYKIHIHQNLTFGRAIEDIALTPLAIAADSLIIVKHLIVLPTED